jgi:hypothetical protein
LNVSGGVNSVELVTLAPPLLLGFTSVSIWTTSRIVGRSIGKSLEHSSATLRTNITSCFYISKAVEFRQKMKQIQAFSEKLVP